MIDGVNSSPSVASQGFGNQIETAGDLKADFLNLLIAQLSNQDPMSPMDNEGMIQQLATFSQLEQLERVNKNLQTQMGYSQSLNNTMMMSVAGKRVTVVGNEVTLQDGIASRSMVRVPEAGTVYPRVVDETGKLVRSLTPVSVDPGFNKIEWDGKDKDGNAVPDGNYRLEISATDRSGAFMKSVTFSSGLVETVQFEDNFVYFEVNGRLYTPADVVEVGVDASRVAGSGNGGGTDDGDLGVGDDDDGTTTTTDTTTPPSTDDPPYVDDPWTPDPSAFVAGGVRGAARSPWASLLGIR